MEEQQIGYRLCIFFGARHELPAAFMANQAGKYEGWKDCGKHETEKMDEGCSSCCHRCNVNGNAGRLRRRC